MKRFVDRNGKPLFAWMDIMCAAGLLIMCIGISFISWKAALIIGGMILFILPIWARVRGVSGVKNGDPR